MVSSTWVPANIAPICAEAQAPLTQCSQTGYMFLALVTHLFGNSSDNKPNFYKGYMTRKDFEESYKHALQYFNDLSQTTGFGQDIPWQLADNQEHFNPLYGMEPNDRPHLDTDFDYALRNSGLEIPTRQEDEHTASIPEQPIPVEEKYIDFEAAYFETLTEADKEETKSRRKKDVEEYDFIIVGAGSAGCLLANRLSEIKEWKILLLEAGSEEPDITSVPALSRTLLGSNIDWDYSTQPDMKTCQSIRGKVCKWNRGKTLGGTSAINNIVYMRGNKRDYDAWAELGNPGWSYREVWKGFVCLSIPAWEMAFSILGWKVFSKLEPFYSKKNIQASAGDSNN